MVGLVRVNRKAVEVSQGVKNEMNELAGNKVKCDSCLVHEVPTDEDIKVHFSDTIFGESGYEVSQGIGDIRSFGSDGELRREQTIARRPIHSDSTK